MYLSSTDFKGFAEEMGFEYHRVTPEHPRANGETESFMKVLNKTEQIAHSDGTPSSSAIQYMLMGYRSTPQTKNRHNRKRGSCQEEQVDYHLSSKTIF